MPGRSCWHWSICTRWGDMPRGWGRREQNGHPLSRGCMFWEDGKYLERILQRPGRLFCYGGALRGRATGNTGGAVL